MRVDRIVTSGVFSLDGADFDVDNNVWLIGDDDEVMIIDAAHSATAILAGVGTRRILAVACTHGHNDHVNAALGLGATTFLHPDDRVLWDMTHPDRSPDRELADGQVLTVAGTEIQVLHTPGHAPGAVCFYVPAIGALFSGDTLFRGGPGATGRSYSDRPTLLRSIRERLMTLPPDTVVHTGHGDDTTIGAEVANLE